jgi:hypothetical protein
MAENPQTGRSHADERRVADNTANLNTLALHWLAALPSNVRPRELPLAYARVANEVARRWGDPDGCLACLNDLLVDRRGSRQGFPMGIALELAHLKSYYETEMHPTAQTVWDGIIARAKH